MPNARLSGIHVAVAALVGLLLAPSPGLAGGLGEAMELEHARANARAGGPVSERDAELLERYGCLSGTMSAFCRKLSVERQKPRHLYKKREQR